MPSSAEKSWSLSCLFGTEITAAALENGSDKAPGSSSRPGSPGSPQAGTSANTAAREWA